MILSFALTEREFTAGLTAEGGMCQSLPEFRRLIQRTARQKVAVIRFQKIERDEQTPPAPPVDA